MCQALYALVGDGYGMGVPCSCVLTPVPSIDTQNLDPRTHMIFEREENSHHLGKKHL